MGNEGLSHLNVASMLDGILELLHEVAIDRLPHGSDADRPQLAIILIGIHVRKDTSNLPKRQI
jgi:hypothetical protein